MLRSLHVRNIAVIEEAALELDSRLTILTGETGAGKSVLVGALQLLLGERASSDLVRAGADRAHVEALFELDPDSPLLARLEESGLTAEENTLLIRREIGADGRSRAFVNDTAVTVGVLRSLGDELVDLHGQHEHQSLIRPARHVLLLDAWAGLDPLRDTYDGLLAAHKAASGELDDLRRRNRELAEKRELTAFQLTEIDALDPQAGEIDNLEREVRRLENAERIATALHDLIDRFAEGEEPLNAELNTAARELVRMAALDERLNEAGSLFEEARLALDEGVLALRRYLDAFDFDQQRCDRLRDRLSALIGLTRKYGGSEAALLARREELQDVLNEGLAVETDLAGREKELERLTAELSVAALDLSRERDDAAGKFEAAVAGQLRDLAMPEARFAVARERRESPAGLIGDPEGGRYEAAVHGIDRIEFQLATDPKAPLLGLPKVASGGEISRIMLALKSVFGGASRIPTLVFDEIDSGIGGRTADCVGQKLEALAEAHQVLAITHLPQIARRGHRHLLVEKDLDETGAQVRIRNLSGEARSEALAVLMSGEAGGEDGLEHARRLLDHTAAEDGTQ